MKTTITMVFAVCAACFLNACETVTVTTDYDRSAPFGAYKTYTLAPRSRFNIWVNTEEFPPGSGNRLLGSTDVSAVIEVTNGVPIIAERSMYMTTPRALFEAGSESATE